MPTDLRAALVTGVEQTVLDLAHRPDLGGVLEEAHAAARALVARADADLIDRLARAQRLGAAAGSRSVLDPLMQTCARGLAVVP
jgi:predicted transcriptional regulator of viral defense system